MQISVGTALTPDHAAVPDVNMVVLKPDQTLPGAGCGIGIKGRTGSPFRNGGAAFGSRYTDNGDPGLLITGIHKGRNQRAGFHTGLVNSGEKILVLSEWFRDGMKCGRICNGPEFIAVPLRDRRSLFRKSPPGHIALPHECEKINFI